MLNHKYNIEDTVYGIYREHMRVKKECPNCGGDGQGKWSNGQTHSCYKCQGTGNINGNAFHKWGLTMTEYDTVQTMTVGLIRCEVCIQNNEDRTIKNVYMCQETGIGSGRIWEESLLWPSMEEAQAECDRRNEGGVVI